MGHSPPRTSYSPPQKPPAPGSLPKLPQSAFNLERPAADRLERVGGFSLVAWRTPRQALTMVWMLTGGAMLPVAVALQVWWVAGVALGVVYGLIAAAAAGPRLSREERMRRAEVRSRELEVEAGLVFDEAWLLLPGYAEPTPPLPPPKPRRPGGLSPKPGASMAPPPPPPPPRTSGASMAATLAALQQLMATAANEANEFRKSP